MIEFAPGERAHDHHQRRSRHVEVGHERVDDAEAVAREDEQARRGLLAPTTPPASDRTRSRARARSSCPPRSTRPPARSSGVDRLGGRVADAEVLGVDVVVARVVLAHRPKRVEPDVEFDRRDRHPGVSILFEELRREVQARCRRGSRALVSREHGLVLVRIGQRLGDVGRQGHDADSVDRTEKRRPMRRELDEPPTALVDLLDHEAGEHAVAEDDLGAGLEPPARLDQTLPRVCVALAQEQDLGGATGLRPSRRRAGRAGLASR